MKLRVLAPAKVVLEADTDKILARGVHGYFCLLPHHADFVAVLEEGPLVYEDSRSGSLEISLKEGLLLKNGDLVLVTTRQSDDRRLSEIIRDLETEFTRKFLGERDD